MPVPDKVREAAQRGDQRVPVPDEVREAAQRGLALKADGYTGARDLGMRRGRQLASSDSVALDDLQVMRAWYARHVATSYPSYERWVSASGAERADRRKWNGAVAWLLWGGTPGYYWVMDSKIQRLIVEHGARHHRRLKPHVDAKPHLHK